MYEEEEEGKSSIKNCMPIIVLFFHVLHYTINKNLFKHGSASFSLLPCLSLLTH